LLCIWDGAGRDRLDLSGFAMRQKIDLRAGAFSDVGGFQGNLSIALGARIEEAVGGTAADRIFGNEGANLLRGGWGGDVLTGGAGRDRMFGGPGADRFVFAHGDGQDRVMDFNPSLDWISLDRGLWGGAALTAHQVLHRFGAVVAGDLVLDFGTDVLTLQDVSGPGLAERILVF
jgi:serralysin